MAGGCAGVRAVVEHAEWLDAQGGHVVLQLAVGAGAGVVEVGTSLMYTLSFSRHAHVRWRRTSPSPLSRSRNGPRATEVGAFLLMPHFR